MANVLTKRAFRAWLEEHGFDEVVGQSQRPCGCPLATYLRDTSGADAWVHTDTWYDGPIEGPSTQRKLPPWARYFVFCVDSLGAGPVTAAAALKALETRS